MEHITELEYGMDFREPKYRKEVFLRFYEFHLKYKAHAGAVYYAIPELFKHLNCNEEQRLWILYLNGCTQNIVTTYILFKHFPDLNKINVTELELFINENWAKLFWDMDRRYVKTKTGEMVRNYRELVQGNQKQFFNNLMDDSKDSIYQNFYRVWHKVIKEFRFFGRLGTFSYLEYLRIGNLHLDCDSLFLSDISGSKSHRNGICKVFGRDNLDWTKQNPVKYTKADIEWAEARGLQLLKEARERINHKDITYFTLETTLCCFKGWFRKNRRYPNVYNDMFKSRIDWSEKRFPEEDVSIFWDIRKKNLPKHLRVEDNDRDVGVNPIKQNHFRNTGQVIMMDKDWDCFRNEYNEFLGG
tara:strand:+ start:908 stop:1978 length:1071 start_codon:yes stop_codon:yes gene_type:complete